MPLQNTSIEKHLQVREAHIPFIHMKHCQFYVAVMDLGLKVTPEVSFTEGR